MEKLITYVDNTFSGVPQTPEILDLRSEILDRMKANYNELRNEGRNENEAIGIIISNFSNISERINQKLHENNDAEENADYERHPEIITNQCLPKNNSKIIKALINSSTYWPLVVLIYLSSSFLFHIWSFSWMIFILAVVIQRFFHNYYR